MTLDDYRRVHPMPWRTANLPGQPGRLVVLDAINSEVKLLEVLDFVSQITARLAPTAQPQPQQQPNRTQA